MVFSGIALKKNSNSIFLPVVYLSQLINVSYVIGIMSNRAAYSMGHFEYLIVVHSSNTIL